MGTALILILMATQDPPASTNKRGGFLDDVNLHDLTMHVQRVTKKTILWTEELGLRNRRTHFVTDRPIGDDPVLLFKAYQQILQWNELLLVPGGKEGEEVYKVSPLGTAMRRPVPVVRADLGPSERFITRIFTLQHASPRSLYPILATMASAPQNLQVVEESSVVLATDYESNLRRLEEIIRALDVKKPDLEMKVVPLKFASATKVEEKMNLLTQTLISRAPGGRGIPGALPPGVEPAKVVADERINSIILLAEPNRLIQLEEIVRRLDVETPYETSGIHFAPLRHRNALDVAKTLNALYRGGSLDERSPGINLPTRPNQPPGPAAPPMLPAIPSSDGQPLIVPDTATNSLLVITDRTTFRTLEPIIRRLDRRRPQVFIKATVVEISASDTFDLGVELARLENPKGRFIVGGRTSYGLSGLNADPATNTFTITPVVSPGATLLGMRDRTGNIPALLHALQGRARVSILDEPEAVTSDNSVATMTTTVEIPLARSTIPGQGNFVQSDVKFEPAVTTLMISPHISESGYLRLDLDVKIEKFTASGDPQGAPTRSSNQLITKEVLVPSGGTMVLGGIVTADQSSSIQGVPFFSDIPLIGALFRREQQTRERRTLYIFVTPTILYDEAFGDHRELTRERKEGIDQLRETPLQGLHVGPPSPRLPESTFRFMSLPAARAREQ